jgi:quercetin dioxygenase-like cupin family protein
MYAVQTKDLDLLEGRGKTDKTQRGRFDFPIHVGTGAASSSVVYFEVAPGEHCGRHTHSAEELIYLAEGTAELEMGDEKRKAEAGTLALAPTMAPHDVYNIGEDTVKVVGFFAAAGVITKFEDPFVPFDTDTFVIGLEQQER